MTRRRKGTWNSWRNSPQVGLASFGAGGEAGMGLGNGGCRGLS